MQTTKIIRKLLGFATSGVIPVDLLPTDRILQRWASATGGGLPTEKWDDTPRASRAPPLDMDTARIVGELIGLLPGDRPYVVRCWYAMPEPTDVIARRVRLTRATLHRELLASLLELERRFQAHGDPTLRRLLRVRVVLL